MKCPKCKGKTEYFKEVFNDGKQRHEILVECDMCHGSGEVQMTNEEWLKSLDTEQLAKFIFWQHFDVYGKTLYELMVNASKGVARDKQAEVMIGAVVEWLKEKHNG